MRAKFVVPVILVALVLLGALIFMKPKASSPGENNSTATGTETNIAPATTAAPSEAPQKEAVAAPAPTPEPAPVATNATAAVTSTNASLPPEERAALIEKLEDWQLNDDKQSLSNILATLSIRDPHVRAAAVEATKQFGSRDAIPALKAAADAATDIDEKIAILDAVKFLSLPMMGTPEAKAAEKIDDNPPAADPAHP